MEAGDGEPGCEKRVSKYWRGRVTFTPGSDSVSIDFTDKGGPAEVVGKWDGSGIVFPDGNKWTKLISVGVGEGQPIMTAR